MEGVKDCLEFENWNFESNTIKFLNTFVSQGKYKHYNINDTPKVRLSYTGVLKFEKNVRFSNFLICRTSRILCQTSVIFKRDLVPYLYNFE